MTVKQSVTFNEEILKIMVDMTDRIKKIKTIQIAGSIPALILIAVGYARYRQLGNGAGTTTLLLGLLLGIVFNILYPRLVYSSLQRMNAGTIGKTVNYTITDYEIFMASEFGDAKMTWEDCERISEVKKYIILHMKNQAKILLDKKKLSDEEKKWILSRKAQ